jgi:phosphoribosylglycinamide formyltransferase-1
MRPGPLGLIVLISGYGSNLQAIIDAIDDGRLGAELLAVASNRADARGLERAREAGVPALSVTPAAGESREAYDRRLAAALAPYGAELIALAGFMRILSTEFVRIHAGRMLNVHPSLLPRHRGLHTHRRALEAGDPWHGTSIHYVTEELDGGPVVRQARVPVRADDDEHSLAARVQIAEHRIYPEVLGWAAEGRLAWRDDRPWLDGRVLSAPVVSEADTREPVRPSEA